MAVGNVRVSFNMAQALERATNDADKVTQVITEELLKDAQMVVPVDSGALQESGWQDSDPKSGQIVYDTPYAAYVHELPRLVSPGNPAAIPHWIEATATTNEKKYMQLGQDVLEGKR